MERTGVVDVDAASLDFPLLIYPVLEFWAMILVRTEGKETPLKTVYRVIL